MLDWAWLSGLTWDVPQTFCHHTCFCFLFFYYCFLFSPFFFVDLLKHADFFNVSWSGGRRDEVEMFLREHSNAVLKILRFLFYLFFFLLFFIILYKYYNSSYSLLLACCTDIHFTPGKGTCTFSSDTTSRNRAQMKQTLTHRSLFDSLWFFSYFFCLFSVLNFWDGNRISKSR